MTKNISTLDDYIRSAIAEACYRENRPDDVQYQYRIIKNYLLFAIKSRYKRVRNHVEDQLMRYVPFKYGLKVQVVYPDPLHEVGNHIPIIFDLFLASEGVDPNHSCDEWVVFGKKYTIRYFRGLTTASSGKENALEHLALLEKNGYRYTYGKENWEDFRQAFRKAYGRDPIDSLWKRVLYIGPNTMDDKQTESLMRWYYNINVTSVIIPEQEFKSPDWLSIFDKNDIESFDALAIGYGVNPDAAFEYLPKPIPVFGEIVQRVKTETHIRWNPGEYEVYYNNKHISWIILNTNQEGK